MCLLNVNNTVMNPVKSNKVYRSIRNYSITVDFTDLDLGGTHIIKCV